MHLFLDTYKSFMNLEIFIVVTTILALQVQNNQLILFQCYLSEYRKFIEKILYTKEKI